MAENSASFEQEIVQLEEQLQEKKRLLAESKTEKEIVHEIVGEKIQQVAPSQPSEQPPVQAPPSQAAPIVEPPSYLSPELKDKIQILVNLAFEKGPDAAIREAAKTNNAALIDAFHDVIVDELYNSLIERKKLEKI